MNPASEIRLIATRELRRGIRSAKGIALGGLTLLGAFVASLVCVWIEGADRAKNSTQSTQAYIEIKRQLLEQATGDPAFAAYLAGIPTSLLIFLKITVWLSPLLVALLGFDAVSAELQHRTIRFWTVRTRRASYLAGKLIGLWLITGVVALALNVLAGTVALARGYVTPGELMQWGVRFWFVSFVISGAWAAVATFISSCFRTPILALMTTFATFFVSWIAGAGGFISRQRQATEPTIGSHMAWYEYFYPNAYDTLLLSPDATKVLTALGILVGFVAITLAAMSFVFERRDI
jgi:ABC-type transport system involved in multi-copper enzyme maturation permease subunit